MVNRKGFERKWSLPNCEVLTRHSTGENEKSHENLSHDSQSLG
jgi:hypothetical protein